MFSISYILLLLTELAFQNMRLLFLLYTQRGCFVFCFLLLAFFFLTFASSFVCVYVTGERAKER